jgi:hypothetical protein
MEIIVLELADEAVVLVYQVTAGFLERRAGISTLSLQPST